MRLPIWFLLSGTALLLNSCTEIAVDNPLLPDSSGYLGDHLVVDSDGNGVADIYEICDGSEVCIKKLARDIKRECGESEQCQLDRLIEVFLEFRTGELLSSSEMVDDLLLSSQADLWSSTPISQNEETVSSAVWSSTLLLSSSSGAGDDFRSSFVDEEDKEEGNESTSEMVVESSSSAATVVGCPDWIRKSSPMAVIGFSPSWASYSIPWQKITQLNYAFGVPTATGGLNANLGVLQNLAIEGHRNGVEVWLSIGGAGYGDVYPEMAANANYRAEFVRQVVAFARESCIDGIDIDWEYWSGGASGVVNQKESASLTALLRELRQALAPLNIKLSADVYPSDWNGRHYEAAIITYIDQLNVMAYDFTGSWSGEGNHSSYSDARSSLNYWGGKLSSTPGYSSKKVMLGVPFYGKDFAAGAEAIAFKDILARYPGAAEDSDSQIDKIYYNAKPLLRQKVELIKMGNWGGVMIWELSQDALGNDANSLLDAIDRAVR